ncbi:MAG: 2-C-methyl-D-erythritol 4-phosphate cytidylyltransferase [Syntrophales bacterium]|nr:2-C-methyl-D-erythritol 4-phosphate cytidylyltransferase [Syntrophales bacterium]
MKRKETENSHSEVVAIVVAGGAGSRMAGKIPKQYRLLDKVPVLVRTLLAFEESSCVTGIIIVVPEKDRGGLFREAYNKYRFTKILDVRPGGATRQDSVNNALAAIGNNVEIVAVHDGVRPLVTGDLIDLSIREGRIRGAVAVGTPVTDTLKSVDSSNRIVGAVERDGLWFVQTPQVFHANIIKKAYEKAFSDGYYGTDDAVLVERIGFPVTMIEGARDNLKITMEGDLVVAEALLKLRRSGGGRNS